MSEKVYVSPAPLVNHREEVELEKIAQRFNEITAPNIIDQAGEAVGNLIPQAAKDWFGSTTHMLTEQDMYKRSMEVFAQGMGVLEKQASNVTIDPKTVIREIDKVAEGIKIDSLDEICLVRSYSISKVVENYRLQHLGAAIVEGGGTGLLGFAGIVPSLVLSNFLFYRAVESIALFYGYDVKHDASEMYIAGEVLGSALNPKGFGSGQVDLIAKFMMMAEATAVKQTAKKSWAAMIEHGGIAALLAQIRALANKAAQKAIQKSGGKAIEFGIFKGIFQQLGKGASLKVITRSAPVVGGVFGAAFDTAQMNQILDYANLFYEKRFLTEKKDRVEILLGDEQEAITVAVVDE